MIEATPAGLGLLQHALGLDARRRDPWRNHFLAGPGHSDEVELEALVEAGLMERRRAPSFCEEGDVVYVATESGRVLAVRHLPPVPRLSKYESFMQQDCGRTFAEWLGIEEPKREYEGGWRGNVRLRSSRATGEWKPTVKEAKASYKAEMARRKAEAAGLRGGFVRRSSIGIELEVSASVMPSAMLDTCPAAD